MFVPRGDRGARAGEDRDEIHSTDLIEVEDCTETCEACDGAGCDECDGLGYIDFSEPDGTN